MMVIFKSFAFGTILHLATFFFANVVTGLTTPTESRKEFFMLTLGNSLFVWVVIASLVFVANIKRMKVTFSSFVARSVFLFVPMAAGWYLTARTGEVSFFMVGMLVSSILFAYDVIVTRTRFGIR